MAQLKRSMDRKVTTLASANGTPLVKNTFGLPSGSQFSCPGATSVCETVCYAGQIEKMYTNVRALLEHNWTLLKDATQTEMAVLLGQMIDEFRFESTRRGSDLKFRIHWDGDFFSKAYAKAWATVITSNPDIQFWVYTRSFRSPVNVIPILTSLPNLGLYLSVDRDNVKQALKIHNKYGTKLAMLTDTTDESKPFLLELTGKPGAACPENVKRIPLITPAGGACISCGLCVDGKANIRFASKHKEK